MSALANINKRHQTQTLWAKDIRLGRKGAGPLLDSTSSTAARLGGGTGALLLGTITGPTGANLVINSATTHTVRLNSQTSTQTTASVIGFQSKPGQGASTANNVIGGEISPRVNDTFALTGSGSLIGLHVDTYLKGTTGNVAGDVRGQQIELVTDDAGTRTVAGNLTGLRMRAAWSGTVTGDVEAIRIEKMEAQTNSQQWEYVLTLTGDNGLIWKDDYGTEVSTIAGAIKVKVNGQDRWIALYSGAPQV